jgi:hypothetical protein
MSYRVKIYTEPDSVRSDNLLALVPKLRERFLGIDFEVLTERIPEINDYPRIIIWFKGSDGRERDTLTLKGYRTDDEVFGVLSAVLEANFVCAMKM